MSWPKTYRSWRRSKTAYPLTLVASTENLPDTLGAHEVLIRIHAVSLNYRDVAMLQEGKYPVPVEIGGVAANDCAAEIVAVGSSVSKFAVGDHVAPTIDLAHLTGEERSEEMIALGGNGPGTLREYAIFEDKVLVRLPKHLSWEEASTLPCTGITAWVSLCNLRTVPEDATALLQGTGGVSLTALLLCIAAGVRPIITSSSDDKLAKVKKIDPIVEGINYKSCPDITKEVLRLTQGNGVDFVINNAGTASIPDDINMLRKKGTIALVGFLEGTDADFAPAVLFGLLLKAARLQGILGGSRADFEALNAFVEENGVRFDSIIDRVFAFDDTLAAYEYLASGRHTGKVVIKL